MHLDKNEFLGVIFGQAIGYALGLGIEFMSREDVSWNILIGYIQSNNQG